ncbi:myb/SANT-like DNA-binding domain-containing protein 3 [Uloborus diversus]|uniref:myb/SANT-like DNA-binding domain-containing protein 3 n=1 Tax=Uloborus diversus TaxID=327109 RepID=UPI002409FDB0|nr:myb/SANT-like DNA-binding domain-containing protein 3 [Uloborus diversus]
MASKTNFTPYEAEMLASLVDNFKEVIECKKTNAIANTQKDRAWEELTAQYNSIGGTIPPRTALQLKNKWKNMKKESNKRKALEKVEIFRTGGGTKKMLITPIEERVASMGILTEPIECQYDSDFPYEESLQQDSSRIVLEEPNYSAEVIPVQSQSSTPTPAEVEINNEQNREESAQSQDTSAATPKPMSQRLAANSRRVRVPTLRRPNASARASSVMVEGAKARKEAVEKESAQLMEIREAEHLMKMRVLEAKLAAYEEMRNYYAELSKKNFVNL